ncbi:hypothetical protein MASR2M39_30310 [Ignavibacteriales bacterium]
MLTLLICRKEIAGIESHLKETDEQLKHVEGLDAGGTYSECEENWHTETCTDKNTNKITELNTLIEQVCERKSQVQASPETKGSKKLQEEITGW